MLSNRIRQILHRSPKRNSSQKNPELLEKSLEYRNNKKQASNTNHEKDGLMHQISYLIKKDKILRKNIDHKRKQVYYVQSIRKRYIDDNKKKQILKELKEKQLKKNQVIAEKVRQDREKRIVSWKKNFFDKMSIAEQSKSIREENRRIKSQINEKDYSLRRSRVERQLQCEISIKNSARRRQDQRNNTQLKKYSQEINNYRKSIDLFRKQKSSIETKMYVLKQANSRKLKAIADMDYYIEKTKFQIMPVRQRRIKTNQSNTGHNISTDEEDSRSQYSVFLTKARYKTEI